MYLKIKELADAAIALQNKIQMEAALREISSMCAEPSEVICGSSFGLAHIKQEGCAVHPDDMDADLTEDQHAKQAAAYERDQRSEQPNKPAKKGAK